MNSLAMARVLRSRVAEKSSDCLLSAEGSRRKMFFSSSQKPRSSIRSASSMTRNWICPRLRMFRRMKSINRPGVPMTTSVPLFSASSCLLNPSPPYIAARRSPVCFPSSSPSRYICRANSLVGANTRARGFLRFDGTPVLRIREKTVMRNAAVLPVPV